MTCWHTLGITPTGDEAAIKKAYAARLREHRPDRDPAGFRRVRAAYEEALQQRTVISPVQLKKRQRRAAAQSSTPSPAAADVAQEVPEQRERETAPHTYLDRPAGREREAAPHDYFDRPDAPAVRLTRWRSAWKNADSDEALLAVLQGQAADVARSDIDLQGDYSAALYRHFSQHERLRSYLWACAHYPLSAHESGYGCWNISRRLRHCRTQWEAVAGDAALLRCLREQATADAPGGSVFRTRYLAALLEHLNDNPIYPASYYWAKAHYPVPEIFGDSDPRRYRDYPAQRLQRLCAQLDQAGDDTALQALLQQQNDEPLLDYPPFRTAYAQALAERQPDWQGWQQSRAWASARYHLPALDADTLRAALLARLQAAWGTLADDKLLAVLQQQAARYHDALQHIDLRGDYCDALRHYLASRDNVPRSTVWASGHYQLHRSHDSAYRQRDLAARIALKQPPDFSRAPQYSALAAWLAQSAWRRRLALWRDWAVQREHPAHQEWQRLCHDLMPMLRHIAAPGLARQYAWLRGLSAVATFLLAGAAIHGGNIHSVIQLVALLVFAIYRSFDELPDEAVAKYHLCRSHPPLRSLDRACRPWPQAFRWLFADGSIIALALYRATPQTNTLLALWFICRFFQTLWSLKRAILVGWQPAGTPDPATPGIIAAILLFIVGGYLYLNLNEGETATVPVVIAALLGVFLYLTCWLHIAADRPAYRRTALDCTPLVLLPLLAFADGSAGTYYTAGALLISPLLILALHCQHRPRRRGAWLLQAFAIAVELAAAAYLVAALARLGQWSMAHGIGILPVAVLALLLTVHAAAWLWQRLHGASLHD